MQDSIILKMQDVQMQFDGKKALDGLTFELKRGEVFGFLGPSGAGKTTTIKLLTRQLKATAGEISLFGSALDALEQTAFDRIGILSDNSGLYERLTVYDNLALFADLKGIAHSEIDAVLRRVGLDGEQKKLAKKLSRGMKQRVMLARAVLHKPELLFLDEPTAALDPGTTQEIHRLLTELNQGGTTIFLTTHNMEEADRLCMRVAFLDEGHIVACDAPQTLKLRYAKDEIVAQTMEGKAYTIRKDAKSLRELADTLANDTLLTLHSQEPDLEAIFLQLTGRGLK